MRNCGSSKSLCSSAGGTKVHQNFRAQSNAIELSTCRASARGNQNQLNENSEKIVENVSDRQTDGRTDTIIKTRWGAETSGLGMFTEIQVSADHHENQKQKSYNCVRKQKCYKSLKTNQKRMKLFLLTNKHEN